LNNILEELDNLLMTDRIKRLKEDTFSETRYMSIEQAKIITRIYRDNPELPINLIRAKSLSESLRNINIRIDEEELIVGNRTAEIRAGVVFPEGGISWLESELENLPKRPQDRFEVREKDIEEFKNEILPFWKGRSLEDKIDEGIGKTIKENSKVVKINQTDHAQGHMIANLEKWLEYGPGGLCNKAEEKLEDTENEEKKTFYKGIIMVLKAAQDFIKRYSKLAKVLAEKTKDKAKKKNFKEISRICEKISVDTPDSFREAVQMAWFLSVILQMESNASSFSPGRLDQFLYPYFKKDYDKGIIDLQEALEIIEALWVKYNQIVYLRSSSSAEYFAGFPINFTVNLGGQTKDGVDASNELSYLFLKAQEHLGLPQPNLTARLHDGSPDSLVRECSKVIGKGSGMPQIVNDESIIPALEKAGFKHEDAMDYGVLGCVELSTQGNELGWSDAAMFNLVKALELTLNNGRDILTGKKIGIDTGNLSTYETYKDLEEAFKKQIDYFMKTMFKCCEYVDKKHAKVLPTAFLSSVVDNCLEKALDITAGGAHYNYSGIQAIQVANIADSLAVIKKRVYEDKNLSAERLLEALKNNFEGDELLRKELLNKVPKYGNDIEWVDKIGLKWVKYFSDKMKGKKNARGGPYHTGLYTVSAHVPMGKNVAATPDGRKARKPLADGGMSAVYGRDTQGPTALLKSVSNINSQLCSNGTLLNMKFSPDLFETDRGIDKFTALLKTIVKLRIHHTQFNVLRNEDLIKAQKNPEKYKNMVVRVAGYTAHFTELARDLQNEIIARKTYGD